MAMLAEPKSKQKWSSDPRNTAWTNDTSRFGYQMLTKMGWQSGKGLGAKEDGSTTHVKSVKRRDNLGLGADKSNEDNWLSHQLEFDDLLSRLNDHSENGDGREKPTKKRKKHEMENTARQSRKRVFYNRFIQSKDLSSKSAEDMACIFGQRSNSVPGTPREQSEDEESDDSTASCPSPSFHGVQTVNSGQSIQEYFEMKMKEMTAARERGETAAREEMGAGEAREDGSENSELADKEFKSKKKKKEKERRRKSATEAGELKSDETSSPFDEDEHSVKKKKKNVEVQGGESGEDKECKVLKKTKQEKRKKKKGKEQEFIASETCEIKEVQSEPMMESLETENTVKNRKKKDKKKRKKDKGTISVDLELSCEIEERNDEKNKLKKARNSNKEKSRKETFPEAEGTKDMRRKISRKDRDALSLDGETVENEMKKEKRKKKKKVK